MLWTLAEGLAAEQRRLQAAQNRCRELMGLLERQKAAYPQALLRCLGVLRRLAQEHRLGTQAQLDRLNTHYLEVKCSAMFLKIRLEELSVLLDTYSPEKVEAHRAIREPCSSRSRSWPRLRRSWPPTRAWGPSSRSWCRSTPSCVGVSRTSAGPCRNSTRAATDGGLGPRFLGANKHGDGSPGSVTWQPER
nr:HAUS augmin-like complex subunit 4 [Chrysemys picta bellii]